MPLGKFLLQTREKMGQYTIIFCKYGHVTAKHVLTECEHPMFGHQTLKFDRKLSHQKFKGS